jgi:glycosyltransferase involved in cell wall biosynthesis
MKNTGRILFNDLILFRPKSGIAVYAEQLLAHLEKRIELTRLSTLMAARPLKMAFGGSGGGGGPKKESLFYEMVKGSGHSLLNRYAAAMLRRQKWDLYHEPDAIALDLPTRKVVTVHDLSVTLFPQWHPRYRVKKFEKHLAASVGQTSRFIAVSQTTKQDLIRYWNIPESKIEVVLEAPRPQFFRRSAEEMLRVRRRYTLPEKFLLFVGSLEPRKNVLGFLKSYATLPASVRDEYKVVLAGGRGWDNDEVFEEIKRLGDSVRYLGYFPDELLSSLMGAAHALIYPSFYEGFGLPPLEAMACGVPVVAARAGSLPEILGEAPLYLDPYDATSIRAALLKICSDNLFVRSLAERGVEHVKKFSWAKAAEQTCRIYETLRQAPL